MTTAFFSSYQEYNYLLNIRTDHLFNILNNTLLLPLCESSRNFSVSQIFWQALLEYHSILKKFQCFGKYVQSYLLQPLSAQEDLWGLSLQLQIKPQKIIIYLISQNKESRKEGIINEKETMCFHIPISQQGERRFKEKPNVLQPQQILYDFQISRKCNMVWKQSDKKMLSPYLKDTTTKAITLKQFLLAMIIIITIPVNFL